jgi:hypothetical protein
LEETLLRLSRESERGNLDSITEPDLDNKILEILGILPKGLVDVDGYAGKSCFINGHSHPSNQLEKGPSIVFPHSFMES